MNLLLAALPVLFLSFVALAAVWSRSGMRYRWTVWFASLAGIILVCVAYRDIIGHPSPWKPEKAPLISYVLDEPKAIYLWLMVDGKPYAVYLPWSIEKAQELIKAKERATKNGTRLVLEGDDLVEEPYEIFIPKE